MIPKAVKRLFTGVKDEVFAGGIDLLKPYRNLGVDYFGATVRYGLYIIFLCIMLPTGLLNGTSLLLSSTFRNYVSVDNAPLFAALNLTVSFIAGGAGLAIGIFSIVSWNRHVGNELHGEHVLNATLQVYQFFNAQFHGVISDITKIQGPLKDKIIQGQRGKLLVQKEDKIALVRKQRRLGLAGRSVGLGRVGLFKNETHNVSMSTRDMTQDEIQTMKKFNLFMITWTPKSMKSLRHTLYVSEAETEGEIWKFHSGTVVYRRYIVGGSVATVSMGLLGELVLMNEIIPIVIPIGDNYQYQQRLIDIGYGTVTKQDILEIRNAADGLMSVELLIENQALRKHIKAITKAQDTIEDIADRKVAVIDQVREEEGLNENPKEQKKGLSKKVLAVIIVLAVAVTALSIMFFLYFGHPAPTPGVR